MYILSESETRAEYKRRWKAVARAKNHGLNTDLIDRFYELLRAKGYSREIALAAMIVAAQDGIFNFVNARTRE